ncbi:MAG TPA: L-threonylcarbamoyladenylate synthase [Acidimicrobiales bacterium]
MSAATTPDHVVDVTAGLTSDVIARTTSLLRAGKVVVVPTETVYGVAVDPFAAGATERLFELKGRDRTQPVAVLVADLQRAEALALFDDRARRLAARFWPGPLTLVLGRDAGLAVDLGVGADTIGLRCPGHPVVRMLVERVGPLATTSANRTGEPTPLTASEVDEVFRDGVALVLDAGRCGAAPSTVVDLTGDDVHVIRSGIISEAEIHEALGG